MSVKHRAQSAESDERLVRLEAERDRLTRDLLEAESTIETLLKQLARAQDEVDRLRVERDRIALGLLRDERSTLGVDQSVAELKRQLAERDLALSSILASRSWRTTALLRGLKDGLRRAGR
jgi:predicted  nucleic acid-binding Zn-ribbon protein